MIHFSVVSVFTVEREQDTVLDAGAQRKEP